MYMFMAFMVTFFISFGQQNFTATAENLFSLTHGDAKMNKNQRDGEKIVNEIFLSSIQRVHKSALNSPNRVMS